MDDIKSIALYSDICIVLQDETHARYDKIEIVPKMTGLSNDRYDCSPGACTILVMPGRESLGTDKARQEALCLISRSYECDPLCYHTHQIQERYPDSYQRSSQEFGL